MAEDGEEGLDVDEAAIAATLGFTGFGTTKGKHVKGNGETLAKLIAVKRKYRQYMNRAGGFNRPLDNKQ